MGGFAPEWRSKLAGSTGHQLELDATLSLGRNRAEQIVDMRTEGDAFTGTSTGEIESPDAMRTAARMLKTKLLPVGNRLVGRFFAVAGDPNFKNVRLPYVLTLRRLTN